MLIYRAYLGLLEIIGSLFNLSDALTRKRFVNKSLKLLRASYDTGEDIKEELAKAEAMLQLGIRDKIEYLTELPTIYFGYKVSLVMEHIDMKDHEYHALRNFYYYKKRYSMLLRYILNIKRDFKDEYEKYVALEASL